MLRQRRIEYPGAICHVMNRGDRREPMEEKARRILREELDALGWNGAALAQRAKGDARKLRIAHRLRTETAVTLKWIATELHMGMWTHVANRLQNAKGKMNQRINRNSVWCKYSGLTPLRADCAWCINAFESWSTGICIWWDENTTRSN